MKLIKEKDAEYVVENTWKKMQLNFYLILNEIYQYISLLNKQDLKTKYTQQINILTNIINQKQLRNIVIDGLVLSDIQYTVHFFNVNLYILINDNLFKQFPNYNSNLYKYINNSIYKVFPNKYIQLILKKISHKLKLWLIQCCKQELSLIKKKIIFI